MGDHYPTNIGKTNCDDEKKKKPATAGKVRTMSRAKVQGGQGGFLAGYAYLFRKYEGVCLDSHNRRLPVNPRFCRARGETKSARENSESTFCKDSFLIRFSHPTPPFAVTQAVSRLLPFIVNAMVARRLTPEEFGVPTVHFQLLSTVILTSREGFRRALMRDTKATEDSSQGTFAQAYIYSDILTLWVCHSDHRTSQPTRAEAASWLVVPLGALLSAGVPTTVLFAKGLTRADPYAQAVALYGLAAFLELFAEPFYIRAQRRSKFKLRLATETIATITRSFVTFVLVTRPATGITVPLAFAFGQLAYGTCVWLMFAAAQWRFVGEGIDLMLGRSSISWGTLTLLGTFTLQVRSSFDDFTDVHERLYLCAHILCSDTSILS